MPGKALERVTQAGESKFVIISSDSDEIKIIQSYVADAEFEIRDWSEFIKRDSGCWVVAAEGFDGMECRTIIAIDVGFDKNYLRNNILRSTSCLIIIM